MSSSTVPASGVPWEAPPQVVEILESISDAFYFVDKQWRFAYINRNAERLWGRSREELLGKNIWECFPNVVGKIGYREHFRAIEEGRAREFETISAIIGRWIRVSIYPGPTGLSVYFRDISAHKRAEEERQEVERTLRERETQLRLALKGARAGSWTCNIHTGEAVWSDECFLLYGRDPSSFKPSFSNWLGCILEEDRAAVEHAMRRALELGTSHQVEFRVMHPGGQVRWLAELGQSMPDAAGKPLIFSGITLDITERRQMEQMLQGMNETLEQRISERTAVAEERARQLQALTSQLALVEERERRRIAVELHDYLAQLLVVCRLRLHRLRQRLEGEDGQDLKEIDALLEESLGYTRTMVAELSPTILYEAGLAPALVWLGGRMRGHGLTVTVTQEGDVPRLPEDVAVVLFQIVRELLFNVVKHACIDAATVRIRVEGEVLQIEVADDGLGFAADHGTEGVEPGRFGLFNSRERLETLGGELRVYSAVDEGSTVTIRLPLAQVLSCSASEAEVPEAAAGRGKGRRRGKGAANRALSVLVVDDHALVREGLRTMIDAAPDMKVVGEAANGEDAIALARKLEPHVVVMDVNMPVMNGIDATRHITRGQPQVKVVGLSVHDDEQLAVSMCEAGASAFVTKGGPSAELYRVIRGLFGGAGH